MLQDVLPKEELLVTTMIAMFRKNPELIASFVAKTLREVKKARYYGKHQIDMDANGNLKLRYSQLRS